MNTGNRPSRAALASTESVTLIPHRKADFSEAMHRQRRTIDTSHSSAQILIQGPEAAATLPQRIGQSASGLLRESIGLPSPRTVTGGLASLHADNTKAGTSSSSTDTGPSSLAFFSSPRGAPAALDQSESFRSIKGAGTSGRIDGQIAVDEFLAEQTELAHEPDTSQDRPASSIDHGGGFFVDVAEDLLPRVQERKTWATRDENQNFTDENNDGAAVVALLSDQSFEVDEPSSILDLESDIAEGLIFPRPHQKERPAPSVCTAHPLEFFDLIPDFGCRGNLSQAFSAVQKVIHAKGHCLQSGFGQLQPWIDILDRYHDEVWGEMLPLVQEAHGELAAVDEKQTCCKDGSAVRRLKMVLQHLDSRNVR